ncbi:MAG TPA: hypothetical protein VMG35_15020 [Bryobacteraceae bacterium]|nr:hypothetical protein [Bryobacteraceae bacterium]
MSVRKLVLATLVFCAAVPLPAGPTLTTIQDVVYNADGTPYNGFAVIKWTPFVAGDTTQIATQSVTVNITGGNLMVQLVPTTNATPAGYYTVTFTSNGNDQFTENWAVPPSITPLRVQAVLMSTGTGVSPLTSGSAPIPESNVIGLLADLAARPVMGAAYAGGRVATIDSTGAIEGASGNLTDCLHVDGSSGPCGAAGSGTAGPNFADAEVPAGLLNGANLSFTLSAAPAPASSLSLYRNGVLQKAGQDYTLSGNTIQFVAAAAPQAGDTLLASYRVTAPGTPQGPTAPQVLCGGMGSATSSTTLSSLATCTIPPGAVQPGDRVKISFDYSHEGSLTGYTFAVNWGNTVLVKRNASVSDALVSGWAEAGANTSASQLSVQSWGTVLPFGVGVLNAYDSLQYPLVLAFQAQMAATTTDTVTLRNYSVVRYPATQ